MRVCLRIHHLQGKTSPLARQSPYYEQIEGLPHQMLIPPTHMR